MLALLLMAQLAGTWFGDTFCHTMVSPGVYTDCVVKVGQQPLPTDSTFMEDVWQYKGITWAGSPFCYDMGVISRSQMVTTDDGNQIDQRLIGACQAIPIPSTPTNPNINP